MKKINKIIKIKLLVIHVMLGTGAIHVKKHDPHIHPNHYRDKKNITHSLINY